MLSGEGTVQRRREFVDGGLHMAASVAQHFVRGGVGVVRGTIVQSVAIASATVMPNSSCGGRGEYSGGAHVAEDDLGVVESVR